MRSIIVCGIAALALGLGPAAFQPAEADTLLVERAQAETIPLPDRGLSMSQVEARFGAPSEKRAPVGGQQPQWPPITRWVYPQFSVYFENDKVVDAVVNQASPLESGPKPVR